ncbi:MAG: T9SS type A sorting domain-containing protein [Bacteroidales bacterium]|nr:T9SS type A sorting domain-containing protein [Bacteroidales bacterium]
MKTQTIFTALLLAGFMYAFGQQSPSIHWRFANPVVYEQWGDSFLQFDIEISADRPGTFHSDLQVYLDYNPGAFGENVAASGNISVERLGLLSGNVSGAEKYIQLPPGVPGVDNMVSRHACLTEALFRVPRQNFMNEAPVLPEWGGLFRYRIRILDASETAGISFVAADTRGIPLMDDGQYYLNRDFTNPLKYGQDDLFSGLYENNLLDFPLTPSGAFAGNETGISIFSDGNNIFIKAGEVSDLNLKLHDVYGKTVLSASLSGNHEYQVTASVVKGIYIAEVQDGTEITTKKVFLSR